MNAGWMNVLLVGTGGFVGSIARYKLAGWVQSRTASPFPFGTLAVNLTGCFFLGWLFGHVTNAALLIGLGTGFTGAFTTFSTLKLDSWKLRKKKLFNLDMIYLAVSYLAGIGLAFAGFYI
ncbi:putative fluoride ion transporter CrcB 2 [Paenibacillus chitinolyticus]|uniref:fluoride efflux transporter FluC n=1 Tax=Paenibacillus chitinolyticus TaxID=79263 RepID=UPI0026E4D279|nr:CrcB family protein [Paenibacillus chitinolyticus]GKS12615.1 putative fluoride ion transporter CrcB 2 [Paenibacillus chitinolyticus]